MQRDSKKRILIIEDNTDILELYKIYFDKAGFEVYVSEDGLTWLVDILSLSPDIILLDINMPQMNGYEVLESLRDQTSIEIPIVVCSSLWQRSDMQRALDLWADSYIIKSDYKIPEIIELITKIVHKSHM